MKISIFTSMTDPKERMDPWKEALSCYHDFADEVVIVGKDWPQEFSWDYIGKTFHEGFEKSTGDWVIRMDLDYFFHENSLLKIFNSLKKFSDQPAVAFPQYQIFTPDRYQVKTKLCIALNKKKYPNAEYLSKNGFYLPSGLGLKNIEIDYVAKQLNQILTK